MSITVIVHYLAGQFVKILIIELLFKYWIVAKYFHCECLYPITAKKYYCFEFLWTRINYNCVLLFGILLIKAYSNKIVRYVLLLSYNIIQIQIGITLCKA